MSRKNHGRLGCPRVPVGRRLCPDGLVPFFTRFFAGYDPFFSNNSRDTVEELAPPAGPRLCTGLTQAALVSAWRGGSTPTRRAA